MFSRIFPIFTNLDVLKHIEQRCVNKWVPVHVRIDLTEICNYGCKFCWWHDPERLQEMRQKMVIDYTGTRHISPSRILKLIDEVGEIGTRAISFTGSGEPLLYPSVEDVIAKVHDKGIVTGITSNMGMKISDSLLKRIADSTWVRWSMNGGSKDTYMRVNKPRGRSGEYAFERACENIIRLKTLRGESKKPSITASVVLYGHTRKDIIDAVQLAMSLGIDGISFRPDMASASTRYNGTRPDKGLTEFLKKIKNEYETSKFKVHINEERYGDTSCINDEETVCHISNHSTMIAANGDIYPCCYTHGRSRYRLGNINDTPFADLWFSEKRMENYKKLIVNRCLPCPYGPVNKVLKELYEGVKRAEDIYVKDTAKNLFV